MITFLLMKITLLTIRSRWSVTSLKNMFSFYMDLSEDVLPLLFIIMILYKYHSIINRKQYF